VAPLSSPARPTGKQPKKIETFYTQPLCFFMLISNSGLKFRKDLPHVRIKGKKGDGRNCLFCFVSVSIFLLSFSFWSVCVGVWELLRFGLMVCGSDVYWLMMIVVLVRENFVEWWRKEIFVTDEFFCSCS
jgi:hypothetical protein